MVSLLGKLKLRIYHMKILLSSAILFLLAFFSYLPATPMHKSFCGACDDDCLDIHDYIHYKMKEINQTLINYDLDGDTHQVNFDYHVGFLNGQYTAYKNLHNRLSPPVQR